MILSRISASFRSRDWAAIVIEFLIVVLGIFAALQAENWNEERKDRQLEKVYLSRLVDETRDNLAMLNTYDRIYAEKVRFISALPAMPLGDAFRQDPSGFMDQLDISAYVAIPDMRSETYQELESSGRLSLIRDTNLRTAIANNLNDYRSVQPVLAEPIGDYRRILFETLPGQSYQEYRTGTGITDAAKTVAALETFRDDPRFAAAANAEIAYGSDTLFWIREFKQRTENILILLQAGG